MQANQWTKLYQHINEKERSWQEVQEEWLENHMYTSLFEEKDLNKSQVVHSLNTWNNPLNTQLFSHAFKLL